MATRPQYLGGALNVGRVPETERARVPDADDLLCACEFYTHTHTHIHTDAVNAAMSPLHEAG